MPPHFIASADAAGQASSLKNPPTFLERDNWIRALLAAKLPHATARIALAIAMRLNVESGLCNPNYKTVGKASCVSERSVFRHVELLERTGWFALVRKTGCSNQHFLLTPANQMAEVTAEVEEVTPANSMAEVTPNTPANSMAGVADQPLPNREGTPAKSGGDPCHQGGRHNSVTAKRTEKKKDSLTAFERWWPHYPRKVAKGQARKAYEAVIRKGIATEAELLAGVMRYAAERTGKEEHYTKHPAGWLSAERWKDAPAASPPRQRSNLDSIATGCEMARVPDDDAEISPS